MKSHTHNLVPSPPVKPTVFECSSCAFSCTPRALVYVRSRPREHKAIRTVAGRKPAVWDLP